MLSLNALVGWALLVLGAAGSMTKDTSKFTESLTFDTIENGLLLIRFQFRQSIDWDLSPRRPSIINYGTFPVEMTELVQEHGVREMRLSFTRGRWNHRAWRMSPVDLASNGIQLYAWISSGSLDSQWERLIGTLSGLFCGSISLLSDARTSVPQLAFQPKGPWSSDELGLRFGILPREPVCTENLTPWLKLLPCMANAGLSSLINPTRIYDSRFNLMDLELLVGKPSESGMVTIDFQQNLMVVFDLGRWTRSAQWSLVSLFDRTVASLCPADLEAAIQVTYDTKSGRLAEDDHIKSLAQRHNFSTVQYASEAAIVKKDIGVVYGKDYPPSSIRESDLLVTRYITGTGQDSGTLLVKLENLSHKHALSVNILEVLPWSCRFYIHTMKGRLNRELFDNFEALVYSPPIDRVRPAQLEYALTLPKESVLLIEIAFVMSLLRYTEYPLDPNRGVDLNGAVITYVDPVRKQPKQIVTNTVLLTLPTPDFTMPFNVIMLTSIAMTFFYGQFFNLLFRRWHLAQPGEPRGLLEKIGAKLTGLFAFKTKQ